ncbi:MAG: hypothetical protein KF915_20230 [Polyangiaceae bacterium]|nr:hypothetical protein [Polyangiaceae bacterium]
MSPPTLVSSLYFVSLTALISCAPEPPPVPAAQPSAEVASPHVDASPAPSAASAVEVLDAMDTRTPVPLLPMMAHHQKENMRDHLVAVQEIVSALAKEDFVAVERAAKRIGYSDTMGRMCTHMGAGAPGFTEQALNFHRTADRIGARARDSDREGVLKELGATLQTCTTCHASWKQQVVDEPTWRRATSQAPPSRPH